jgi:sugar phosphate isomerase/epimerase
LRHTIDTVRFAAELNATTVIVHAGYVKMRMLTPKLIDLCAGGRQDSQSYERTRTRLLLRRQRKAERFLGYLFAAIEELVPVLEKTGVRLAFENLPSWEAVPSEAEMARILEAVKSPCIAYWHDIGHGQTRQNLGLVSQTAWLPKLAPSLAGMHIHDVLPPARDHLVPGAGEVAFDLFLPYLGENMELVLEPAPGTEGEEIRKGAALLRELWGLE